MDWGGKTITQDAISFWKEFWSRQGIDKMSLFTYNSLYMTQMATITSKMQLTLPIAVVRKIGIKSGQKVTVSEENGKIIITPAERLVEQLAGSLRFLKKKDNKTLDEIIEEAKNIYFKSHKR